MNAYMDCLRIWRLRARRSWCLCMHQDSNRRLLRRPMVQLASVVAITRAPPSRAEHIWENESSDCSEDILGFVMSPALPGGKFGVLGPYVSSRSASCSKLQQSDKEPAELSDTQRRFDFSPSAALAFCLSAAVSRLGQRETMSCFFSVLGRIRGG